jgi:phosphate transport system substrate-binding protein
MRRYLPTLLALAALACQPDPPPLEGACLEPWPQHEGLRLAGSGSNLPLARALLQRFHQSDPWLAESIGTTGAVRALRDGAIDVGLASRPLRPDEQHPDLLLTPLASTPVVFVGNGLRSPEGLRRDELVALYEGHVKRWADGRPVILLAREPGDSGLDVFKGRDPALAAAIERARHEGRALVQTTDQEMERALLTIPGALGYADLGLLRLGAAPLWPLPLDGASPLHAPSSYPFHKELAVITRAQPSPEVARWLAFLQSPEARDVLSTSGYAPPR